MIISVRPFLWEQSCNFRFHLHNHFSQLLLAFSLGCSIDIPSHALPVDLGRVPPLPETVADLPDTAGAGLQRILFNLVSNVVRYGADGKYLGVFLRADEKSVYIDVTDKGKGIDKQFANSVFDRLFILEDSRNRNIQGNCLGLTIAKTLYLPIRCTIPIVVNNGIGDIETDGISATELQVLNNAGYKSGGFDFSKAAV